MLMGAHSRVAAALAMASVLVTGTSGCSTGGNWAFCVSRTMYADTSDEVASIHRTGLRLLEGGGKEAALVTLGILLLPVAIDLVLLPVTLTRDLTIEPGT